MRRLVVIALALGVGGALGAGSAAGASSSTSAKHVSHAAATRAKSCTKRRRARLRRCHPTYRMSAKRLHPLAVPAKPAAPTAGAPAPTTTTPVATTTTTTPATATAPPPPVASTIGVSAHDGSNGFYLLFSHVPTAPAGDLTVFFHNLDVSDHNLWIQSPGGDLAQISDAIGYQRQASRTVAVSAGTWRLFCSLPGHEAMTENLTVTP